ncbi:hypothetical protein VTL71DRAFT_11636 [Oculimacula yallundae]|uniref:Uncharacterized protein n=1 Tax=Oculimacula yallundae TaxID=86028 RepID=A0ABR4CSF8_9HELO
MAEYRNSLVQADNWNATEEDLDEVDMIQVSEEKLPATHKHTVIRNVLFACCFQFSPRASLANLPARSRQPLAPTAGKMAGRAIESYLLPSALPPVVHIVVGTGSCGAGDGRVGVMKAKLKCFKCLEHLKL